MPNRMPIDDYVKVLTRYPTDVYAALQEVSHHVDRSVNGTIVHILRDWLTTHEWLTEKPASRRRETTPA